MHNPAPVTRRQALATFAAGTAARYAFAEGAPLFRYSMIDHLAIAVDDNEKSIRFYSRVFGNDALKEKNGPRHYIKLGPRNYIAMAPPAAGEKSQIVHHICPGIVGWDHAATKRILDQNGLKYRESPTVGFFLSDPDGIQVQLWTEDSWKPTLKTAIPANLPSQGEPLIRPLAIDHVLINVSDVDRAIPFYEKVLGPIINPKSRPRRTWFSGGGKDRVALGLAGPGYKLGVDHFCLTANFERASLAKGLEAAGATIVKGDVAEGLDFLDPNGIHIQILPPNRQG